MSRKLLCSNAWDKESCVHIWKRFCRGWVFSERKGEQSLSSVSPVGTLGKKALWGKSPVLTRTIPFSRNASANLALFGKEPSCQRRRWRCKRHGFDPCAGKILWRWAREPTPAFFPRESHRRGGWWATVHGVAEPDTRSDLARSVKISYSWADLGRLISLLSSWAFWAYVLFKVS